ncbi:carbon storage regulator CsrA [Pseudogracilibacillus auburnensis]|uniref:Translational regulator CsrA n=1 Tax=Pseudogracilibacillus auburnensis TaxID=1494959 RepID=A0A2V3W8P8_9BACI|nr:carbon storage regulator CsrA [Pseudogracilibacillus auburnensis]MBO1001545.1 carbon storage regulator CsrA [Pseudogracilibacillus auburnensis]PXW89534.1 carbon storage regulator CsrA [Pseudogracilibacillus auburnensis]
MLVLKRKTKEAIRIGEDVEISILAIEGDQVKIGISAPKSVEIHRKEIYDSIQKQNSEAASLTIDITTLFDK